MRHIAVIAAGVLSCSVTAVPAAPQPFELWSGPPIPSDAEKIPFVPGIVHRTIHRPSRDEPKFLHGAAIMEHKGVTYANWANSPVNENGPHETLQGRRSGDGGVTWSELEVIGPGFEGRDRHSHGVLFVHQGELWTICARFGVGTPGRRFPGLQAEAFVLDEQTDRWRSRGIVMKNCWPYDQPVRMANGNYITGGQDKDGLPVVAISHGDNLTKWDSILIPYDPALQPNFAETTVWAEGARVIAVIRGGGGVAWVSTSDDHGRTWSKAGPSNLPMPRAKAYLGKLSTGQLYLLSNLGNRDTLCVSVSRPGEQSFSRMWRIRHGKSTPPRFPGRAKSKQWSYPYGYEHDGKLFVVYSIGKEDCGLSVLPVASLAAVGDPEAGTSAGAPAYQGRSPTASWRTAAEARIEQIRRGDLQVSVVDSSGKPLGGVPVTVAMKRHAFGFGSAVTAQLLSVDTADARIYRETVEKNYNKVVFENDLKWQPWEVGKSGSHRSFRRGWVERALGWLNTRDIEVRGHYVSWAPLKPQEVGKHREDPEGLRRDLFAHIDEKLPAVGARVGEWDAVNHIVGWGPTLSDLLGGDSIYTDVIRRSRRLAPGLELWINEGQILPGGSRRDAYERMAGFLAKHDASPDGIGFMGHFTRKSLTPPAEIYKVLDRFAALSPKLQLTELDVDVGRDERLQADYLRDVMISAFSHPAVEAIVMWGFWEGRHWRPDAALYRRDWSMKPAGEEWQDLVFDRWWTTSSGKTDSNGAFSTRGFLGDYEIAVEGSRKMVGATLGKQGTKLEIVVE